MMRFLPVIMAFATAHSQICELNAPNCTTCTSDGTSSCGWCDGILTLSGVDVEGNCIDSLTTEDWSCSGLFKDAAVCDCLAQGAPGSLVNLGILRGLQINYNVDVEVQIKLTAVDESKGALVWTDNNGMSTATVYSIQDCARSNECAEDQIFITFTPGSIHSKIYDSIACTVVLGWQSGPDAQTVALGCKSGLIAPDCFDYGELLFVLYACQYLPNCPWVSSGITQLDHNTIASEHYGQNQAELSTKMIEEDECSSSDCVSCTQNAACAWCVGVVYDANDSKHVESLASCFKFGAELECQGTSLADECTVYKCPWHTYFDQDINEVGDCSELTCTKTTGDDPDFVRTDTPAAAFNSANDCNGNCVDPTVMCLVETLSCNRSYSCNASSTCESCQALDLPTRFKGVQIDFDYSPGIWTFDFDQKYTSVDWTSPDGVQTHADITNWILRDEEYSGQFLVTEDPTLGGVKVVRAARMKVENTGALGRNTYLAISPNPDTMQWNQGDSASHNGTEFALIACEYDQNGQTISGRNLEIVCALE